MRVARVSLRNVRSLPDREISFCQPDGRPHDAVLVTGPAASGKTTLLEVIAMAKERVGGYGSAARPRAFLRPGEPNGHVGVWLVLDEGERRRAGLAEPIAKLSVPLSGAPEPHDPRLAKFLASYSHGPDVGLMDYFPAGRALSPSVGNEPPPDERTEGRLRLGREPDKYRGVLPWLRAALVGDAAHTATTLREAGLVLGADAPDPLQGFRQMLAQMCPWLRVQGLSGDGSAVMFVRRGGGAVPALELSDAERDAVLLCASWQRLGLCRSVALIDRLEQHAHPDDQKRWLDTLTATGDNQLIVATSSERLLQEVPAAQHVVLARD